MNKSEETASKLVKERGVDGALSYIQDLLDHQNVSPLYGDELQFWISVKRNIMGRLEKKNMYPVFEIGDIVKVITDPEQFDRMVVGILQRQNEIYYIVKLEALETVHAGYELAQ